MRQCMTAERWIGEIVPLCTACVVAEMIVRSKRAEHGRPVRTAVKERTEFCVRVARPVGIRQFKLAIKMARVDWLDRMMKFRLFFAASHASDLSEAVPGTGNPDLNFRVMNVVDPRRTHFMLIPVNCALYTHSLYWLMPER